MNGSALVKDSVEVLALRGVGLTDAQAATDMLPLVSLRHTRTTDMPYAIRIYLSTPVQSEICVTATGHCTQTPTQQSDVPILRHFTVLSRAKPDQGHSVLKR